MTKFLVDKKKEPAKATPVAPKPAVTKKKNATDDYVWTFFTKDFLDDDLGSKPKVDKKKDNDDLFADFGDDPVVLIWLRNLTGRKSQKKK